MMGWVASSRDITQRELATKSLDLRDLLPVLNKSMLSIIFRLKSVVFVLDLELVLLKRTV